MLIFTDISNSTIANLCYVTIPTFYLYCYRATCNFICINYINIPINTEVVLAMNFSINKP